MQTLKIITTWNRNLLFNIATRKNSSFALTYNEYGDPIKVLKKTLVNLEKSSLGPKDVKVKILAATINPADINTIQGTYGIKATLPAIGGNEGVAEVEEVGSKVNRFKVGSWVIPSAHGSFNTWRTNYVGPEDEFIEVPNDLSLESAVTLLINPCTAFRMLKDFVPLKENDSVIQNGANSSVGQAAIQIAKLMKVKTINVVRNRENLQDMKNYLTSLGADFVVTEEELRTPAAMEEIFKIIAKPKLAFNCVGGKSTTDMMRHLTPKGVMVTYGGMSRQPVTIPTTALIFKDLEIRGFWLTRWTLNNKMSSERMKMLKFLADAAKKGEMKPAKCVLVPFDNFTEAIQNIMVPFISQKYVLVMDPKYLK